MILRHIAVLILQRQIDQFAVDPKFCGGGVVFYNFLVPNGGEPLRWKFELEDGSLVGTFSAQHDNPTRGVCQRLKDGAPEMIRTSDLLLRRKRLAPGIYDLGGENGL